VSLTTVSVALDIGDFQVGQLMSLAKILIIAARIVDMDCLGSYHRSNRAFLNLRGTRLRNVHRSGIAAETKRVKSGDKSVGQALLEETASLGADLLAQGAYI